MQALGVTKLYVAYDGSPYGAAIAYAMKHDLSRRNLPGQQSGGGGRDVLRLRLRLRARPASSPPPRRSNPTAKLFGPSALADPSFPTLSSPRPCATFTSPRRGSSSADLTPAGTSFVVDFTSTYGHAPVAQAIFGYEAMSAVLAVLKEAGSSANSRSTVVNDFSTQAPQSVLGPYSMN